MTNKQSKDAQIECEILRDYWDEDAKRHRAGERVFLPAEAAMDGVEAGILSRVKG